MKIKIAAVQMKVLGEEPEHNLASALRLANEAVSLGAHYIVFPEFMISDFSKRMVDFAEPIPGPTTKAFLEIAEKSGAHFVISVSEKVEDRIFNSAVLISSEGITGVYRKTHLWRDEDELEGLEEPDIFNSGSELPVFDFGPVKAGVMICWDAQYPEVPRVLSLKGAEIIFYPNNRSTIDHAYISALALRNVTPIVAVNRVGVREIFPTNLERTKKLLPATIEEREGRIMYRCRGDSAIFDEAGRVLVSARDEEKIITAEIDIEKVRLLRERSQYLHQRRPDLYGPITESPTN